MGLVIPDGYGQVTLDMDFVTGPSNPMACVIGYDPAAEIDAQEASFRWAQHWNAEVMAASVTSNNLAFIAARTLHNPGGEAGFTAVSSVGPNGNYTLPPQVALLVRKVTGSGGRENRGRLYMPGIPTDGVNEGGILTAGAVGAWQSVFSDLFAAVSADIGPLVVLHSDPLTTPTVITSLQVQGILATQRRRIR